MDKIRVGVIGTGSISQFHLDAYAANPDVEIAALCDLNRVMLDKRGDAYGVDPAHRYEDYNAMLVAEKLDAVSVCTWNSAHMPCTIAALEAGANVLCEKPMATSAADAERMLQTAEKCGKLLMIGFVRRFGDDCELLKTFIDQGDFGELYHAKATYLRRKGNPGGWFGDKSRSGGGPLIDLGVHVIDLTRYLMGNPKPVSVYGATFQKLGARNDIKTPPPYVSSGATDHDICDVEDFVTAMIRYDNGAVVNIDASFALNLKKEVGQVELFGTKAGAKLDPELEIFSSWNGYMTNVDLITPPYATFGQMFVKEVGHFVDCVRTGQPTRNPAADGVAIMRILDAVYASAAKGGEVTL